MRRDGGAGPWFWDVVPRRAHTWTLQATARRFGSITVRVPVTSRARLTKSGSFLALRSLLRPVAGVLLTSQAAPPALAPLAPATGRSPPPRF